MINPEQQPNPEQPKKLSRHLKMNIDYNFSIKDYDIEDLAGNKVDLESLKNFESPADEKFALVFDKALSTGGLREIDNEIISYYQNRADFSVTQQDSINPKESQQSLFLRYKNQVIGVTRTARPNRKEILISVNHEEI
jgi:hypothetical protein